MRFYGRESRLEYVLVMQVQALVADYFYFRTCSAEVDWYW